ncbi:hypothetical protein [Streptomyces scabiei]|uniref:hypothetical protein n=1 Tax=Streptomyces scabiei TaxID=1930 RepID=UPI0029B937FA|nr:hypothetical protein [Streptomyces scabiei]MDX3125336.1 hypothetical protein [Streptomyces scabiei]MDX3204104.1 hypothetical protein [Streptomyces scabiei]MDX3223167.1 hypothetical protein [Streptomyces scabiei]
MIGDDTPKPTPTPEEEGQARAYLAGIAYGFGIAFEQWIGCADGTATTTPEADADGDRLIYTGDELHPFDAVIPCARHKRHRVGVTWPQELEKARADTARCSVVDDPPTLPIRRPRLAVTPSPLWLITRAASTPGEDRQNPAS